LTINPGGWSVVTSYATPISDPIPPVHVGPYIPYDLTVDAGIFHDGRDQALELASAIPSTNLPNIYAEPSGIYGVEQTLTLTTSNKFFSLPNGVFRRAPGGLIAAYIVLKDCQNVSLQGPFELWGREPDTPQYDGAVEFSSGLLVRGGNNVTIEDYFGHNIGGDALVGGAVGSAQASNLIFRRIKSRFARRQGVSFNNVLNLLVEDLDVAWCGRSAVDIEPFSASVGTPTNLVFRRIRLRSYWNYGFAARGAGDITLEDVDAAGGLGFCEVGGRGGASTRFLLTTDGGTTTEVNFRAVMSRDLSPFPFTALALTDQLTAQGHGLANDNLVTIRGSSLPAPLVDGRVYAVRDVSGPTFRLADTVGGVAIDLTIDGSGTFQRITPRPMPAANAPRVGSLLTLSSLRRPIIVVSYDETTGQGVLTLSPGLPAPSTGEGFTTPAPATFCRFLRVSYASLDPDRPRGTVVPGSGINVTAEYLDFEDVHLTPAPGTGGPAHIVAPRGRIVNCTMEAIEIDTAGRYDLANWDIRNVFTATGQPTPITFLDAPLTLWGRIKVAWKRFLGR